MNTRRSCNGFCFLFNSTKQTVSIKHRLFPLLSSKRFSLLHLHIYVNLLLASGQNSEFKIVCKIHFCPCCLLPLPTVKCIKCQNYLFPYVYVIYVSEKQNEIKILTS